ncbi:hypothetical protein D9M71_775070 [compost metagenome]
MLILNRDLLLNGEHWIAGGAVACNFDRLIRKRNRGVVSVAGGAFDGVDAATSQRIVFVVVALLADRAFVEFDDVWPAALHSAIFIVVNFAARPTLVKRPDFQIHGVLQCRRRPPWPDAAWWQFHVRYGLIALRLLGSETR